ncbi:MAG: hypothetical protein HY369_02510 [Candidatus Aenigmarchaeota archaeon]|nr:hypothetical protein [Candidatus Aenigmarchaeota archaeon]
MPESRYFLKLSGVLALGLLSLLVGFLIFILLAPVILAIGVTVTLVVVLFVVVWMVIYLALLVGAILVNLFRPAETAPTGNYTLAKVREAGRRRRKTS